ncbi:oxidoreductase NAD-binding domain-containing protein 1 [Exaiptasia diaphana]|uniref:Oxidoreductase NAD-binding domain-containing protein 1 n=1 Tax=Exaiptasia diaphana TaxID=2652724 RepID=A0A913X8U8_EXADI|nr:oxidoreductase NAD-binding domain-containing protein 1 [Exaiptasia diaphana]KXJ14099.1 Oxidoreductase NAD-binding domain-containing protein 1 [Exaiptasia diaphana]
MLLRCHRINTIRFSRLCGLRSFLNICKVSMSSHIERTESSFRNEGIYLAKVIKLNNLSSTVKSLDLQVADGSFGFKPGQWVDFIIPGLSVVGGFSICSSPEELLKTSNIQLAVKYSDHPPAKWVHTKCKVGDKVQLRVGGDFHLTLPQSSVVKPSLLFIAGGVGINPLLSMLKFSAEHSSFYGNTALLFSAGLEDELLFKSEIISICKEHRHFKCSFFVSKERKDVFDQWTKGGRITKETIKTTIASLDVNNLQVYICGPQSMISFVSDSILALGISNNRIHFEKWW